MDATSADPLSRFSETVRKLRTRAGLTQEAFAEKCDLSTRYVQMIESGRADPGLIVIGKIAGGMGLRPSALLRRAGL